MAIVEYINNYPHHLNINISQSTTSIPQTGKQFKFQNLPLLVPTQFHPLMLRLNHDAREF